MIAKTATAPTFAPVARYLAGRGEGTDPARVAWTAARNLPTDDPALSADLMQATASQNLRVESPAYHLTLSFAPEDHPSRALVEDTADRVLSEMGLSDHQALLVAHHDRQHRHIHLLVNRVHPETFVPWDRWHDHIALDRVLAAVETEHGLRRVPARDARIADRAALPVADREVTRTPSVEDRPLIAHLRELLPTIRASRSWDELREQLHHHDITLEPRAHGLVFADGSSHVKASRVAADTSLARLESRLGPYSPTKPEPEQAVPTQSRIPYEIARVTDAAAQRLRQAEWAVDRVARSAAGVERALATTFVDPATAAAALTRYESTHGAGRAADALREHPEQFGTLATTEHRHLFGLWTSADERAAATEAANLVKEWTGHTRQARDLLQLQPGASADAVRAALSELRDATADLLAQLPRLAVADPTSLAPALTRLIERVADDTLNSR
jgi:hypothetical protein